MGYTRNTIKGVSWIGAIRIVTRLLSFAKTLVIARALAPHDFGLFGIATLVLTFVEIFTETGINVFLMKERENIDKYISTAWIVSIIRGLLIASVIAVSSPFVANFFKAEDALPLLLLISLVPLARGFINPSIIKFQKDLLFQKEFFFRTSIFLIETAISVGLVLLTNNVLSLIIGLLVGVLFEIYLSFMLITPRPKFTFEMPLFKNIIGYGKWITASTVFNYFYQHGDDIIVGRLLGTGALGLYDMAYRISLIPLSDVSDVVTKVTFPVYVKIADDKKRFLRAFLQTMGAIGGLTIPVGILLFFFPEFIISLLLGEKWLGAAPVLKILAIFGVVRALSVFCASLFLVIDKQRVFTLITLVGLVGLSVPIIPLTERYGIVGAGTAALIGTTLTIPVIGYYLTKFFTTKSTAV